MKTGTWLTATAVVALASFALGAETRKSFVDTYSAVADTILGSKKAEAGVVRSILESHHGVAHRAFQAGKFDECAAEMALFANEGDNQVGGIRKRLLAGGHHHNAEGEAQGIYEAGFVTVTRDAKKKALAASMALQQAKTDDDRKKAWADFAAIASDLLDKK